MIGTGGLEDGTGSDGSQNIDQNAGQNGNQNAGQSGVSTQEPIVATDSKTLTISDIKYIDIDGNTYVYLIDGEQNIYRQKVADNDALLFLQVGENLNIAYNGKELVSFEVVPEVAD